MGFVVNVARKGQALTLTPPKHIFRTAMDSITQLDAAIDVALTLRQVYTQDEFEITVTEQNVVGRDVFIDEEI